MPERRAVRAQLIGYQQLRHESLLFEQLAHQSRGRPAVAPALYQHVEDLALVVDGTPETHPLASNTDHHLVQMPSIVWARTLSRDRRSKLRQPAPDGLLGDVEPTLGEEILYVSVAEREAQVEPDSMLDDNRRKAAAV
jgi:hypothetical protein